MPRSRLTSVMPTWLSVGAGESGERCRPRLRVERGGADGHLGQPGHQLPRLVDIEVVGRHAHRPDQFGGVRIVRETEMPSRHPEAVGDPGQHVVGDDLPSTQDLRHLRLRLTGQRGDPALRHPEPLQQAEHAADVAGGESRTHVLALPDRRVHPFRRSPVRLHAHLPRSSRTIVARLYARAAQARRVCTN